MKKPHELTRKDFEKLYSRGFVYNNVYYTSYGEPVKFGDPIHLEFLGPPNDMPEPWILLDAKNEFSTVNYKYNVTLWVRAANGKESIFNFADHYSPKGKNFELYFKKYINDPLDNAIHKKLVKKALKSGLFVPDNVLKDYPDLKEKYQCE